MPTLKEVYKQIRQVENAELFGTRKEIQYLPQILSENEQILALVSGLMEGKTWLVVCTSKRVIFLDKGMFYGLKQSEIPLQKINSIEQNSGFIFGEITIWYGSHKMLMTNVKKRCITGFVNSTNKAIEDCRMRDNNSRNNDEGLSQELVADELTKLAKLRDQGVLSEEEFSQMKKKLIS